MATLFATVIAVGLATGPTAKAAPTVAGGKLPTRKAVAAPAQVHPPYTDGQRALLEVALARRLPAWVTALDRKRLAGVVADWKAGNTKRANARWAAFVRASEKRRAATVDAAKRARHFDTIAAWVTRRALLGEHKRLETAAHRLATLDRLHADLAAHRAQLAAAQSAGTVDVTRRVIQRDVLVPSKKIHAKSRAEVAAALREVEAMQEDVRNRRQMASTAFQNFDQKSNQMYNLLSAIMKAANEMRMGTVRNML
ncbi:MAG: hypothetical protein AAF721_18915 [Myxococcota bacterium]